MNPSFLSGVPLRTPADGRDGVHWSIKSIQIPDEPPKICNDPRAAGTSDRVVTDLILVMEKSEECRSEWVQEIPRVPQSREHKCLQL